MRTLFLPRQEPGTNAFRIVLARRHGSLEILGTDPPALLVHRDDRTVTIVLSGDAPDDGIALHVEATGEAPRIVRVEERRIEPADTSLMLARPSALPFTTTQTPVEDIFAWRAARATGAFAREKRFFNALDRATWVQDGDYVEVQGLIDLAFSRRHAGDSAGARAVELTADRSKVQRFSDVFRDCIQAEFGDPHQHLLEVEDCFDRFARGELSMLDSSDLPSDPAFGEYRALACQPDSIFHLYFAEFAGLCATQGVTGVPWRDLLPCLVQSQEAFHQAYAGPGGDPILPGDVLGGRWPPASPQFPDVLHRARDEFKRRYGHQLDAVRENYAQQFVAL